MTLAERIHRPTIRLPVSALCLTLPFTCRPTNCQLQALDWTQSDEEQVTSDAAPQIGVIRLSGWTACRRAIELAI